MQLDPKYDHYDFPTTAPNKQSGHPGHTTPEQDAQVFQLRTMLEQAGYTERLDTLTLVRTQNPFTLWFRLTMLPSCDFYEPASSMSHFQRRCTLPHNLYMQHKLRQDRFVDCEKWRKDINLDDLVRNFDYKEKVQVFEYYPQYYHKIDKVLPPPPNPST